jgi:hypothetical protein
MPKVTYMNKEIDITKDTNLEDLISKLKPSREEYKKEYNKVYYQKNKKNNIIICSCGKEIKAYSLSKHKKSKHHQNYLNI